jgi:hypothetical protein
MISGHEILLRSFKRSIADSRAESFFAGITGHPAI